MKYDVISADGHVDLIWLPPDLFTANASAAFKDRMPHVVDGPKGPYWTSKNGANFGLVNGMGSAGREYVPGVIHRSDRMASTGLYDDGKKGVRRLTEPGLRLKDQDRDGVQAANDLAAGEDEVLLEQLDPVRLGARMLGRQPGGEGAVLGA